MDSHYDQMMKAAAHWARSFEDELRIGSVAMDLIAMKSLAVNVGKGNMTAIIWYMKNRMGRKTCMT